MSKSVGFTLIELMIVVALVGIISAIAYPSYQNMLNRSARATAQADLMGFAAAMERHHAARFTYQGAASAGANTGVPAVFTAYSPAAEGAASKRYNLRIHALDANGSSYELRAIPLEGSALENDGVLVLYSDGRKAWDKNNDASIGADEFCWQC